MAIERRDFLRLSALAGTAAVTGFGSGGVKSTISPSPAPTIAADVVPITLEERKARVAKAQGLLIEQKLDGLVLDAGTSMTYFTGIYWWPSERTMVAVIPARGEVVYVCPAFEEGRLRELIRLGHEVLAWQEDENPFRLIQQALKKSGTGFNKAGIEERTRFFISDGLARVDPQYSYVSGDSVSIPCRIIKSPAEIALLQKANDFTVEAIKACIGGLKEGMTQQDAAAIVDGTHQRLGGRDSDGLILFGTSSSLPHGGKKPQQLKKGDIVLMDCGCRVEGYTSDITRTIVFGAPPTQTQKEAWQLEQKAQGAAFAAAKIGAPCEMVDAAVRAVLVAAGFGPDYKLPGTPHRTGHGIGMDGHEWGNMVRGNKMPLQAGMCFSLEPTFVLPGEFGVRMEDCIHMTEDGPRWFSGPALSIDKPF